MSAPAIPPGITATATTSKPWYLSRTLIINALGLAVTLIGGAVDLPYVKAHAQQWLYAAFVANTLLRLLTTQGLSAGSNAGATGVKSK